MNNFNIKQMKSIFKSGAVRDLSVFSNLQKKTVTVLSLIVAFLHIYSAVYTFPDAILLRSFHASVFVAFAIFWFSPSNNIQKKVSVFDYILMAFSLATLFYLILNLDRFILRWSFSDSIYPLDLFFGVIFILILFEAARRVIGWPMLTVAILFFLYPFFGNYLTGIFSHAGFKFDRVIELQYLTTLGMYGMVAGVSATFVFMFILFGSVMRYSGGSEFFFSLGRIIGGAARGGAAKTAVVASAFFGMISGSANANVATTGSITIPMMKRLGYRPEFAAAVEAAASSAGTITPPVMGAVIFLLAEFVGVPYRELIVIAAIPAFIYYWSVFIGIDREAIVQNLKALPKEDAPNLLKVMIDGVTFIIPMFYLVYKIFRGIPPTRCAFESTLLVVFCAIVKSLLTKNKDKISLNNYIIAVEEAVKGTVTVAIACVLAGTIVGNIYLTGVGIKFSSFLMRIAMGNAFLTICLAALLTIIFGMGVPVSASYVLAVSLAGPALIKCGIPRLNAHFFVAWFAALATITPPVCISSYIAAGIAEVKDSMKVGWIAVGLASGGFVIPVLFVYRPELLLRGGSVISTLFTLLFVAIGVFAISTVLFGQFLYRKYKFIEIVAVIASGIMLYWPSYIINISGLILFSMVAVLQYLQHKDKNKIII
jgi:TRAP transporter 4TM/12TM fusion protein